MAVLALGCRTAEPPTGSRPTEVTAATTGGLASALEASQGNGAEVESLHLVVECREPETLRAGGELRELEVWGSGVGVWRGSRQFELDPTDLEWIARELRDSGFATMPDSFGRERRDPGAEQPQQAVRVPPMVLCRILLELGAAGESSKEVLQFDRGEVSEELVGLADRLLDRFADAGSVGRTIVDLEDGLAAVAGGELAPEVLTLSFQRKPLPKPGQTLYGLLLQLHGRRLVTRPFSTDGGFRDARELTLSASELTGFLDELDRARPWRLPATLYSLHTTDLRIRVLDRSLELQARRRPGVLPQTHGDDQAAFDRLTTAVEALHREAMARGRIVTP